MIYKTYEELDDHSYYQQSLDLLKQAFDRISSDSHDIQRSHVSPHLEKWQRVYDAILDVLVEYDPMLKAALNARLSDVVDLEEHEDDLFAKEMGFAAP